MTISGRTSENGGVRAAVKPAKVFSASSGRAVCIALFLSLCCCGYVFRSAESPAKAFYSAQWRILTDSGWAAASGGQAELYSGTKSFPVKLRYLLKKTDLWQWPEITFSLDLPEAADLSGFSWLKVRLRGPAKEEMYIVVTVEDKNTGALKPCICRIRTAGYPIDYKLPFSAFVVAPDWTVRNPGYSKGIEWGRTRSIGVHKKGADGGSGSLLWERLAFYGGDCPSPYDIEKDRSSLPRRSLISLEQRGKKDAYPGRVEIFPGKGNSRTVGRYLYGVNLASWLDLPDEEQVRLLRPSLLRLGGPFLDRYSWRSGSYTFPGSEFPVRMFGLDRFVRFCRSVGSEPLIQVNALGLSGEAGDGSDADKEAAEMVRYLNGGPGRGVQFFEIGNEPFIWHLTHRDLHPRPCSAEEYTLRFGKIAGAMRRAQRGLRNGRDIRIFAPAISTSWQGWRDCLGGEKSAVEKFLAGCASLKDGTDGRPLLDVLSFHLFDCFSSAGNPDVQHGNAALLDATAVWWKEDYVNSYDKAFAAGDRPAVLPRFRKWMSGCRPGLELAVTEFNIESESMVNYDMIWKVLYLSDLYGILAEEGVDYAAQFCLNSSDQNIAMLDDTGKKTALYHPFRMYSNYFSGVLLDKKVIPSDWVSVYASRPGRDYTIMAVNKANEARDTEFLVGKDDGSRIVFHRRLPALSLSCIRLKGPAYKEAEVWEYGREQIN